MRICAWSVWVLIWIGVSLGAGIGGAQTKAPATAVGSSCDLRVFGEKNTEKFLIFDHDLRKALETRDVGKLGLLIDFPLRIADGRGSYYIHDVRALEGHFEQIFTPAIRTAILATKWDGIECNYVAIRYGEKPVIWVDAIDRGFFLSGVNLRDDGTGDWEAEKHAGLACVTGEWKVLVDSNKKTAVRYRAWKNTRSLFESPDVEIASGKESVEGTGPCAHREWSFQTSSMEVHLEEPGCYGEVAPPSNAQARLTVKVFEEPKEKSSWCY